MLFRIFFPFNCEKQEELFIFLIAGFSGQLLSKRTVKPGSILHKCTILFTQDNSKLFAGWPSGTFSDLNFSSPF